MVDVVVDLSPGDALLPCGENSYFRILMGLALLRISSRFLACSTSMVSCSTCSGEGVVVVVVDAVVVVVVVPRSLVTTDSSTLLPATLFPVLSFRLPPRCFGRSS